jgi:hypothetical protein
MSKRAIQPYRKNPFFWQHKEKPILLLGGTDDDNLFQWEGRTLTNHLNLLKSVGGNYVRNSMSSRDPGNLQAFAKLGDRYDLNRWDDEYWKRFETFLRETARRDIIVQIEVWDRFDFAREPWSMNPFNPKNNRNYTAGQSRLLEVIDAHPSNRRNAFFRSVPKLENNMPVLACQQAFVDKMLSFTLQHTHILYCIDNETNESPHWGEYWAGYIRAKAREKGVMVHVTQMWDPWDLTDEMHDRTFKHPEIYSFVDVSQNNHQKGQAHYDNALSRRVNLRLQPRPMNNVKIYGADTGQYGTTRDGTERFWRNLFGGHAAARFHHPASGIGLSELAQRMLKSARAVTGALQWFNCEPHNELLSDREPNEAYCFAEPGKQYAVYFPQPGEVRLKMESTRPALTLRWYSIDAGVWQAGGKVSGSETILQSPGTGQWAAVIR